MRAFSAKKYSEPRVGEKCVVLASRDGKAEVKVFESVKFITLDNKAIIYQPKQAKALVTASSVDE